MMELHSSARWIFLFITVMGKIYAEDVTRTVGSTGILNCLLRGSITWRGPPAESIFARKDQINFPSIPKGLRKRINITGDFRNEEYNLLIENIEPADGGLYKCELDDGSSESFNVKITGIIIVTVSKANYVGHTGQSVTLGCHVHSPSSPVSHVVWYKSNGTTFDEIETDYEKYTGSTPSNPSLTIKHLDLRDLGSYKCSATNKLGVNDSSKITNVSLFGTENDLKDRTITFISVTVSILILILVISIYVLRKKKPVFLLQLVYKFQKCEDDDSKTWDAFVSFKSGDEDYKFVMCKLYPKLEKEFGFKLCIHHKDFLPGKAITNNILDSILNSRRTILVISKEYLQGGYTTFEYEVAHSEMINSKHQIIPILLDDIENLEGSMDDTLKYIIQSVTYITWPGDSNRKAVEAFWRRVKLSMPKKAKKRRPHEDSERKLLLQ